MEAENNMSKFNMMDLLNNTSKDATEKKKR